MKSKYNNKEFLEEAYQRLKNGRKIAEELGLPRSQVYRWLKQYGITNQKWTKHSVDEKFFKEINTKEKSYYLGLIMADGCIYKGDSPRSYVFQMNLSIKDKNQLIRFNERLNSDYPIKDCLSTSDKLISELTISNTEFCKNLMNHGVLCRKTQHCSFPDWLDSDLKPSFLRGFFDGDGCIYHNPKRRWNRMEYSIVGTKEFLFGLQRYLSEENGIASSLYSCTASDKVLRLVIARVDSLKKIYHLMYDDSNSLYYSRKKNIFDDFIKNAEKTCPAR